MIKLDQKHKDIISAHGHLLVTGGPGSGKTTIALLKAQHCCRDLKPGQEVLFLSFSRAAVRQILTCCYDILNPIERKLIQVKTYHLFCLQMLEIHGRLLCGQPVMFLYPGDERLAKSIFHGEWNKERLKLAKEQSLYCFDLIASAVASLIEQSEAVRTLLADKYPLVIIDEFQDTDNDQWRIIRKLMEVTEVFCLADPDQRIFEYRGNVDPHRINILRKSVSLNEYSLGNDNHRSPSTGILQLADSILHNRFPLPKSTDVTLIEYHANNFELIIHAAVLSIFRKLREKGIEIPCVAVLCRSNAFAAKLSGILGEDYHKKSCILPRVEHDILWDAELSAAAAQVVGSILEWPVRAPKEAIIITLQTIAHFYRIKNAEVPSKASIMKAKRFSEAAVLVSKNNASRIKAVKTLEIFVKRGISFSGDPVMDWRLARQVLQIIEPLNELYREARMIRLFRATDALGNGLSELWLATGSYAGAAVLVKHILDRQRIFDADHCPKGCVIMNMHKAKGKEFDGVVLVEGTYESQFIDINREKPPYSESRRLLRVAITRARNLVSIIRPKHATPLVSQ